MQKLYTVKTLLFGTARYHLDDGEGDAIILQVDYANNDFKVIPQTAKTNIAFRAEVADFAAELLVRKHGVNFAAKFAANGQ